MLNRREFLRLIASGGLMLLPPGTARPAQGSAGVVVNDIHSQLNSTRVARVAQIDSVAALRGALASARKIGQAVSIAGGRHAMGGQQFGAGTLLLDTRAMKRVLKLDTERGLVHVEAGIQWPELVETLVAMQANADKQWGIVQKQTGADRLTLGGALSANVHGRGLKFRPIVGDVEAFTLMDADGELRSCSRTENPELFHLAIGGYGLFGAITDVTLRLMPRTKLERVVEIIDVEEIMPALEKRIAAGYLYGDCQFSTDISSDSFLKKGVFSCYRPLPHDTAMPTEHKELAEANWRELYYLAHTDTKRTYDMYSSYYLSTTGQKYWSDIHQLSVYIDDYHKDVDRRMAASTPGTEMICEFYTPRSALGAFLRKVREDFRASRTQLIYGTIRLIEKDDESFLAWAKEPYACTVMNLHVLHSPDGIRKAQKEFRGLIDRAIEHGGSYFLTYHRWARRAQVDKCYPQMAEFLRLKKKYDRQQIFQSDWYRHYRTMYADKLTRFTPDGQTA